MYLFYIFVFAMINVYNFRMVGEKTEINQKLGKRIKYLRMQKGLSQEKLAEAIDIATTSLSYVETGRGFMTLSTLEKLAKVLDVELYEVFQFSSIDSSEKMYEYIITKLNRLRNDEDKIKITYNILKNIL